MDQNLWFVYIVLEALNKLNLSIVLILKDDYIKAYAQPHMIYQ